MRLKSVSVSHEGLRGNWCGEHEWLRPSEDHYPSHTPQMFNSPFHRFRIEIFSILIIDSKIIVDTHSSVIVSKH